MMTPSLPPPSARTSHTGSLMAELAPGLDGLSQLRALMTHGRNFGIAESLEFQLVEVEIGRAVFAGTPGLHAYNAGGIVHGGYAATLLDSACGCAALSRLSATQDCTTLELKVSYHRALTQHTGRIHAVGSVLSLGRRVAYTEARLLDTQGKLYASATSTLLILADTPKPPARPTQ